MTISARSGIIQGMDGRADKSGQTVRNMPITPKKLTLESFFKTAWTVVAIVGTVASLAAVFWACVVLGLCMCTIRLDVDRIDWEATKGMLSSVFTIPTTIAAGLLLAGRLGLFPDQNDNNKRSDAIPMIRGIIKGDS
jgi:hypothetical protein